MDKQVTHLRSLADLLGPAGLQRRPAPEPEEPGLTLQARISQAFRTRYLECFLAEPGPESTHSRSAA